MLGIYHYNTLKRLHLQLYKDCFKVSDIQKYMVYKRDPYYQIPKGYETYLLNVKTKDGDNTINYFPMKFDKIKELPIRNDLYKVVEEFTPIQVQGEKILEFRDIIDNLVPFQHSARVDFKLFKIIALASLIDRCNLIISTPAGFGKDSVADILGYFIPEVSKITPTSMAALMYRVENRLLIINEITDLKPDDIQLLQLFLSTAGAFNNNYENPKRGINAMKTKDVFDISKLSILLYFNTYEYFVSKGMEKKYFDNVFKDHIADRFLAIRFDGELQEDFHKPEITELLEPVIIEYKNMIKSIRYYIDNPIMTIKYQAKYDEIFGKEKLSTRHKTSLYNICKYIAEYSSDEVIFEQLANRLKNCIAAYYISKRMSQRDVVLDAKGHVVPSKVTDIIYNYSGDAYEYDN